MSKRAVILAGGKGTRLRPYTVVLPKPLMPIGDFPILEVIVKQLARHGFDRITLAINHQAEIIKAFFSNGSRWNTTVDFSVEPYPLSTMGPLKLIKDLPDNFLVMNGDILTDLSFGEFYAAHVQARNSFTISAHRRHQVVDYGVLESNAEGKLVGFKEKPATDFDVSMGIYMVNRSVLDLIPTGRSYGFDNLMFDLIAAGRPASIIKYPGYWLDIGRPDDYAQAIEEFEQMRSRFDCD